MGVTLIKSWVHLFLFLSFYFPLKKTSKNESETNWIEKYNYEYNEENISSLTSFFHLISKEAISKLQFHFLLWIPTKFWFYYYSKILPSIINPSNHSGLENVHFLIFFHIPDEFYLYYSLNLSVITFWNPKSGFTCNSPSPS